MKRRVFFSGILLGGASLYSNFNSNSIAADASVGSALDHQVSITASTTGRFREGYSWNLSVNSAGRAHLVIASRPATKAREFNVPVEQIQQLLEVMRTERFFELKGEFGEEVADGSVRTLTIVDGGVANTVSIRYLMDWLHTSPRKLKDPARALRVFRQVRGWFNDTEAVDLTKYDDAVLLAVARIE